MATIAFLLDVEEGHLIQALVLAGRLARRGHALVCLGSPDIEARVRAQGLRFVGVMPAVPAHRAAGGLDAMAVFRERCFDDLVTGRLLDRVMARERPDAVIVPSLYALEALAIRFRYRVPVLLFTSMLPKGSRETRTRALIDDALDFTVGTWDLIELARAAGQPLRGLKDLARLLLELPEVMSQHPSFDLPRAAEPNLYRIGPLVDPARADAPFSWDGIDRTRTVVLCALGSQAHLRRDAARQVFRACIDAAARHDDWVLIVSLGHAFDALSFGPVPPNVVLRPWVPQVEVLRHCRAMVSHAGIGSIHECIHARVPVVAFPLIRDQFDTAELIVTHGIGVRHDPAAATPDAVDALLTGLLADGACQARIEALADRMAREVEPDTGPRIVEQLIGVTAATSGTA